MISLENRLNIESGSTTENRLFATRYNISIRAKEIFLIAKKIILRAWFTDIYQMIRYFPPMNHIIIQVFSCANGHVAIHLPAVSTNDFCIKLIGQMSCKVSFPGSRRAENCNQWPNPSTCIVMTFIVHEGKVNKKIPASKLTGIIFYPSVTLLSGKNSR